MRRYFKHSLFFILPATLLTGCFSALFNSDFDTIMGEYNVGWIADEKSRTICKGLNDGDKGGEELFDAYIFSVGYNAKYIVAKQHPYDSIVDLKTTNYFVIDYSKHPYAKQDGIYGPMNWEAYQKLNTELSIGEIDFDMNYPEDPN